MIIRIEPTSVTRSRSVLRVVAPAEVAAEREKAGVGDEHGGKSRRRTERAEEQRDHEVRDVVDRDAHAGRLPRATRRRRVVDQSHRQRLTAAATDAEYE